VAVDALQGKLEEIGRLAAASRRKLAEITSGLERLRQDLLELGRLLGVSALDAPPDEAKHEFEDVRTEITQRHEA